MSRLDAESTGRGMQRSLSPRRWAGAGADAKTKTSAAPMLSADRLAYLMFVGLLVGVIFLQKVALPGNIELILAIAWGLIVASAVFARIGVDVGRFLLFGVFASFVIGSSFLQETNFSRNSLLVGLAIQSLLVFKVYVRAETYLSMMRTFIKVMLLVSAIVGMQHVIQFTIGVKYWPNLNAVIPVPLQFHTYNYLQPISWGAAHYKPNGVFFLETSVLSQFIALALVAEFVFFRRIWALLILMGAEVASMGGTGLMLLLFVIPFLVPKFGPRTLAAAVPAAVVVLALALSSGWAANVSTRMNTFSVSGSSANSRFVQPALYLLHTINNGVYALTGIGAGNIPQNTDTVWWTVTKVSAEYGVLAAIALYIYLIYSMFKGAASRALAMGCLTQYSILCSSYAVPLFPITCMMLCTLFHVRADELAQMKRDLRARL
jgi:hypothetical protein